MEFDKITPSQRLLFVVLERAPHPLSVKDLMDATFLSHRTVRYFLSKFKSLLIVEIAPHPYTPQTIYTYQLSDYYYFFSSEFSKLSTGNAKVCKKGDDLCKKSMSEHNLDTHTLQTLRGSFPINLRKSLNLKENLKINKMPIDLGFFQGYTSGVGEEGLSSYELRKNNILFFKDSSIVNRDDLLIDHYFLDISVSSAKFTPMQLPKALERLFANLDEVYGEVSGHYQNENDTYAEWMRIFNKFEISILKMALSHLKNDRLGSQIRAGGYLYIPYKFETFCLLILFCPLLTVGKTSASWQNSIRLLMNWRSIGSYEALEIESIKTLCSPDDLKSTPSPLLFSHQKCV